MFVVRLFPSIAAASSDGGCAARPRDGRGVRRDVCSEPAMTQPRIEIAAATREQIPLVFALIRELAEYEKLAHTVVATEALLEKALFGPRPAAEAIIARLDTTPVGFALFFTNFSTFEGRSGIYLEDLFVRPPARGNGVGKALLAHLARLAVERGCARVEWSVLDWNKPAICFYESLGARAMDEWTVFRLTGDAITDLAAAAK